jgi:hypothetical protein
VRKGQYFIENYISLLSILIVDRGKTRKFSSEENICAFPNKLAKLITCFTSLFSNQLLLGGGGHI